jgi:hypothetical protein
MKKVIISIFAFSLLICSQVSAWEVDVDNVKPNNSAKAFEERLNALETLAGKSAIAEYIARWCIKGKWMGCPGDCGGGKCRNGRSIIGHLWASKDLLEPFKNDLRTIESQIKTLEAENVRRQ